MTDSVPVVSQATLRAVPKPHCLSPTSVTQPESSTESTSPPSTFIAPRSFNTINLHGSLVVKSSFAASIQGELYFYQHIPRDISHLFPQLHWHIARNGQVSFAIDRVFGTTFSARLVEEEISDELLLKLLRSLTELHRSSGLGEPVQNSFIYASYSRKVAARFSSHKDAYSACGLSETHFGTLLPLLQSYESEKRGCVARVIHGDPVLTNVLASIDGSVKLIDMRGAQGGTLTLAGDSVYDFGKVVQSLCGYDHILADKVVGGKVLRRLVHAKQLVREYVEKEYEVSWDDVILVVCSLFTSLIPLHDNIDHRRRFARVAEVLLACVTEGRTNEEDIVSAVGQALKDGNEMAVLAP